MDRRRFLSDTVRLGGLYTLSQLPLSAFAQTMGQEPRYMIAIQVAGSMHSLEGADPLVVAATKGRDFMKLSSNDWFVTYRDSDLVKKGSNIYGASAKAMQEILPDVSVINGVIMLPGSSSHETNRGYFDSGVTGNFEHIAKDLAMYLEKTPVSYISDGGFSGAARVGNLGGNIISTDDVSANFLEYIANNMSEEDGMASTQKALVESRKKVDQYNKLFTSTSQMSGASDVQRRILAAFNSGITNVAVMQIYLDPQLDTHSNHTNQHPLYLKQVFESYSSLIKALKSTQAEGAKGKSLFDLTTVVMYTEFSRSSYAEGSDGTAHNQYTNSVWIAGGKIKGGMKVGASDIIPASQLNNSSAALLHALPYDFGKQSAVSLKDWSAGSLGTGFCTAAPTADCVDFIKPSNVWATVYESMGVRAGKVKGQRTLTTLIKR